MLLQDLEHVHFRTWCCFDQRTSSQTLEHRRLTPQLCLRSRNQALGHWPKELRLTSSSRTKNPRHGRPPTGRATPKNHRTPKTSIAPNPQTGGSNRQEASRQAAQQARGNATRGRARPPKRRRAQAKRGQRQAAAYPPTQCSIPECLKRDLGWGETNHRKRGVKSARGIAAGSTAGQRQRHLGKGGATKEKTSASKARAATSSSVSSDSMLHT